MSISLRFPMQEKGFSLFLQWIVQFSSLVHPCKLFRKCLTNLRFLGWLFKFLIDYEKKGVAPKIMSQICKIVFLTGDINIFALGVVISSALHLGQGIQEWTK